MASEHWNRLDALFHAALDEEPAERAAFLEAACAGDIDLRAEVEAMLAADDGSTSFMQPPSSETVVSLLQPKRAAPAEGTTIGPYTVLDEIASGGMGTVYRAVRTDGLYEHAVALKVIRRDADTAELLARFRNERQMLARLDHPNVARLIDGGATEDGRPYLVMEFVDGQPIDEYCDAHALSVGARLELFQTVASAVHYAHQSLVVHRDLKPSNILVSKDGAPKLLDFGIAKVLAPDGENVTGGLTLTGARIMTPAYASPEQVRGDSVTTATDVYSLGVVLYELLTGRRPYRVTTSLPHDIERAICEEDPERPSTAVGRPASDDVENVGRDTTTGQDADSVTHARSTSLERLRRTLAGDLDTIVLMAMRKEPDRRYPSVEALRQDVRRHLEGLPVIARRDTWRYRSTKFVRRNKLGVALTGAVFVALAVGALVAARMARIAEKRLAEVLRLGDLTRVEDYEAEVAELWPALPHVAPAMRDWLANARELVPRLEEHRALLDDMRARALPYDDATRQRDRETHFLAAELADLRVSRQAYTQLLESPRVMRDEERFGRELDRLNERIVEAEERVARRRTWSFATRDEQWTHDRLAELVHRLERFVDPERGKLALVEQRLEAALAVRGETVDDHAAEWERARASIADPAECPAYDGRLRVPPQVGLIPIGRDRQSGLWEFAHLPTGEPARHGLDGRLEIREETGLVFVLLPGGTFRMGAEPPSHGHPAGFDNVDPVATDYEVPVHDVRLDPFFMSKYEMTQGQWMRFAGENPSLFVPGSAEAHPKTDLTHPVEQVSWKQCGRVLGRLGLRLPTEAQWEYAARSGTDTPWWTGVERESLAGAGNLADAAARRANSGWGANADIAGFDDGYSKHAPVHLFEPNYFGLHNVVGNVWEWCSDDFASYELPVRAGDGERMIKGSPTRVGRGGSFQEPSAGVRSSDRSQAEPGFRGKNVGVRPARAIDR